MANAKNITQTVTLGSKLATLEAKVTESFASKNESEVLAVRKSIESATKKLQKIRAQFDTNVDNKSMFGADLFPKVTRIRKEGAGRPKNAVEVDTSLDF